MEPHWRIQPSPFNQHIGALFSRNPSMGWECRRFPLALSAGPKRRGAALSHDRSGACRELAGSLFASHGLVLEDGSTARRGDLAALFFHAAVFQKRA